MKKFHYVVYLTIALAIGLVFLFMEHQRQPQSEGRTRAWGTHKWGKAIKIIKPKDRPKTGRHPARGPKGAKTEFQSRKPAAKLPQVPPKIIKNEYGQQVVAKQLLVTFISSTTLSDVQGIADAYGLTVSSYTQRTQTAHIIISQDSKYNLKDLKALLIREQPKIISADYNHIFQFHQAPPSEFRRTQSLVPWHIYNDGRRTYLNDVGATIRAQADVDIANGQFLNVLWNQQPRRPDCHDIVVAVLDTGIDLRHEDLQGQFWINPNETPNNGIDDDQNGIIDDINGAGFTNTSAGLVRTGSPAPFLDPEFVFDQYTIGNQQISIIDQMQLYNSNIARGIDPASNRFVLLQLYAAIIHGTNIAGIIGALGNNNAGTFGVCQSVKIMAIRTMGVYDIGNELKLVPSESALIAAMNYARDQGADIMNASWGFLYSGPHQNCGDGYLVPSTCAFYNALKGFSTKPGLIVASSGNANLDNDQNAMIPASLSIFPHMNTIAVAAIEANGEKSNFSNYGRQSVDIAAPGNSIVTITLGDQTRNELSARGVSLSQLLRYLPMTDDPIINVNGTSYSAPMVVGGAAAIKQALQDNGIPDTPQIIKSYVKIFATGTDDLGANYSTDARRLNLFSALNAVYSGNLPPQTNTGSTTGAIAITESDDSGDDGGPIGGCGFIDGPQNRPPWHNWPLLVIYILLPLLLYLRKRWITGLGYGVVVPLRQPRKSFEN